MHARFGRCVTQYICISTYAQASGNVSNAVAKSENPMQILKRIYHASKEHQSNPNVFDIVKKKVLMSKPKSCLAAIPDMYNFTVKHAGSDGATLHTFAALVSSNGSAVPGISAELMQSLGHDFKARGNQGSEFRMAAFASHCIFKNVNVEAIKRMHKNSDTVIKASTTMCLVKRALAQSAASSDAHLDYGLMAIAIVCRVLDLPVPAACNVKSANFEGIAYDAIVAMKIDMGVLGQEGETLFQQLENDRKGMDGSLAEREPSAASSNEVL